MKGKPEEKRYMSPGEAAKTLMVTPTTLRLWVNKGALRAETTLGGHRRYPVSEIMRIAREKGIDASLTDHHELRVLIVDDDEPFSAYLREALSQIEEISSVSVAHSGFDAGSQLTRFEPDVVLLDLKMPGLDGFDVCKMIKSDIQTQHIRVVAMSGYCSPENRERILSCGAEDCLAKPFRLSQLEQAMGVGGGSDHATAVP